MGNANTNVVERVTSEFDDKDGNTALYRNKLRTLLILCPVCKMYKLPENTMEVLGDQLKNGFPVIPASVCKKCCLISEQEEAIDFLNDQIHELTNTVERWRNIRSIEQEIDVSYSCIHTPTRDGNLSNHSYPNEITSPVTAELDGAMAHKPEQLFDFIDNEIENISKQFSRLQVGGNTGANTTDNENFSRSCLSEVSNTAPNTSQLNINSVDYIHLEDNAFITMDVTPSDKDDPMNEESEHQSIITISAQDALDAESESIFQDYTNSEASYNLKQPVQSNVLPLLPNIIVPNSTTYPVQMLKSVFNRDDLVETLVIGDHNIKHMKLHAGHPSDVRGKIYKVQKPNAYIPEMMALTEHLIRKRFKNVRLVILHAGVNDAKIKGSEEIKDSFTAFYNLIVNKLGKHLILSGPIPNIQMSSETFSRSLAINSWLAKKKEFNASFVENFSLFWSRSRLLFERDQMSLNLVGASALSNRIICNMTT